MPQAEIWHISYAVFCKTRHYNLIKREMDDVLFVRNYRGALACPCAGSSLEALFLNLNNLTGTILSAIQASSPLEALALGGNALTGALLACTPPLCCINKQANCWLQGVPSDS